jgi:hypothetical protein
VLTTFSNQGKNMQDNRWKVKMVRRLTNKVSPDVICESTFTYELPADYGDMLNGIDHIDEELHQSVFESIQQHLFKKFGDSLFFGLDLVPPYEDHKD